MGCTLPSVPMDQRVRTFIAATAGLLPLLGFWSSHCETAAPAAPGRGGYECMLILFFRPYQRTRTFHSWLETGCANLSTYVRLRIQPALRSCRLELIHSLPVSMTALFALVVPHSSRVSSLCEIVRRVLCHCQMCSRRCIAIRFPPAVIISGKSDPTILSDQGLKDYVRCVPTSFSRDSPPWNLHSN